MRRCHAMPFGVEHAPGGFRFRLWAPDAARVALRLESADPHRELAMEALGGGWHELVSDAVEPGTRYRFVLDGGVAVPDPASRFQPDGPHGPSEVIDPTAHVWRDGSWRGRTWEEIVLYELHVGAFTSGGRFADAIGALDDVASLGATAIELMPLAECPGARNWGYDGAQLFAPESAYGRPEDLKGLVEAAHERGLAVFVDVVYNHFGPEGNYLGAHASPFFTRRHRTPWGAAIDFEGPAARPVRDFFIHNALYWLEEYGVDGLRLDAVHAIHDASQPDVLEELALRVRERFAGGRPVHLVLENDANEARRLARDGQGEPRHYTAQWNDDCHHAFHVLLTGERAGYYADYADDPIRHLGRALAQGFAYQGEPSPHRRGAPRGERSADLPPTAFVDFLQNHDQIGNRAFGERLARLAPPHALRAGAAVLLLAPAIPLLFMGEEWGAPEPFPFFCDFGPDLADAVRNGRRREFAAFPAFRDPAARERIPDPGALATFRAAVLDRRRAAEPGHAELRSLHRALLAVRHRDVVPRLAGIRGGAAEFEKLADRALRVRWTLGDRSTLVLLANLADAPTSPSHRTHRIPADFPSSGAPGVEAHGSGSAAECSRLLFELPDGAAAAAAQGTLAAWSVVWTLTERVKA